MVAEIIGGIAIVASLVFVGLQIRISAEETRQNTATARASAYQDLMDSLNRFNEIVVQDDDLTTLWANRFDLYDEELGQIESERLIFLNRILFRTFDAAYYSYIYGNLGDVEWRRFESNICNSSQELMNSKQNLWSRLRGVVSDGLENFIEEAC